MECVVDLSFSAGWFQPAQGHTAGARLLKLLSNHEAKAICPALWSYEVLNLVAVATRRGTLSEAQADMAVELLNVLPVRLDEQGSDSVRRRIHRFAREFKLTAYDAAYLELADRLQLPLLTRDGQLTAAAKERRLPLQLSP